MKKLSAPRLDSWDRPIRPGLPVSATPGLVGTLGAVVRDRYDGTLLLLGTSHVLCPFRLERESNLAAHSLRTKGLRL